MSLEVGTEVLKPSWVSVHVLLPADLDVEFSATFLTPCPPTCCILHDENGLNLSNCKQAPINCFLLHEFPCGLEGWFID